MRTSALKTSDFPKFMLCLHGQGKLGQCGQEGGGGLIFRDFVRTSFMDDPNQILFFTFLTPSFITVLENPCFSDSYKWPLRNIIKSWSATTNFCYSLHLWDHHRFKLVRKCIAANVAWFLSRYPWFRHTTPYWQAFLLCHRLCEVISHQKSSLLL